MCVLCMWLADWPGLAGLRTGLDAQPTFKSSSTRTSRCAPLCSTHAPLCRWTSRLSSGRLLGAVQQGVPSASKQMAARSSCTWQGRGQRRLLARQLLRGQQRPGMGSESSLAPPCATAQLCLMRLLPPRRTPLRSNRRAALTFWPLGQQPTQAWGARTLTARCAVVRIVVATEFWCTCGAGVATSWRCYRSQVVTGFSCRHATPLRDSYVWWPSHECFLHYDVTLHSLREDLEAHTLERVRMDTNCR
jgi:hypothetical protein